MKLKNSQHKISRSERFAPSTINMLLTSGFLSISDESVISLKRSDARREEEKFVTFDLNNYFMPPNALFPEPVALSTRHDIVAAMLLGLDNFISRTRDSHTRTRRVSVHLIEIVMFYEAMWVRNVIVIESMTPLQFLAIANELAVGGWPEALMLNNRARRAGIREKDFEKQYAGREIKARLCTAYSHCLEYLKAQYLRYCNVDPLVDTSDTSIRKYSASRIRSWLASANLLYDAQHGYGLKDCPFPDAYALSRTLGLPEARTRNLSIGEAGKIFRVSMIWVYERAPLLLALLEEMVVEVEAAVKHRKSDIGERLPTVLQNSENRRDLENLLPFELRSLDATTHGYIQHSVRSAITGLMAACFVLLAFMNARRKSEVSHKMVGLMCGSLTVRSEALRIYEVKFYVAKTYRQRMPFYVNETTCDAIRTLEEIQALFTRIDKARLPANEITPFDEIPLFSYRRLSVAEGIGTERIWFDFHSYGRQGDAASLVREALGTATLSFGTTHIFRRMYALIFFYRYENADIVAIARQFGHVDLKSILVYLTDPASRADIESIFRTIPTETDDRRRAYMEEMADLEKEIRQVGDQKLGEEVFAILAGEPYAGGYARYVRKLHARFAQVLSFAKSSASDAVYNAVKQRGHFPRPYSHGECMLGTATNQKAARCYSIEDGHVHQEKANATTCANCRFHLTKAAYVENLEFEREQLSASMNSADPNSFETARRRRELKSLDEAIASLRSRLGMSYAQ
ncbi:hypothetical protein PPMP20_08980 [Paraburkholderia phymatum]|uniref:hypothetical protein n=1 Tax=Paraburkholderia phymatum TaxID=148447 RepID=UPI0012FDAF70|nr:hypothetical protein [Paraburkholderia phymatum]